jgi:hypothetical protein
VSANEDLEKRAAAAVAYALQARAIRRDFGGARIRDYDLLFDDRPDEPLEITRFADQEVMQTWARLERADREAPTLKRDWSVDVPSKVMDASGKVAAYDLDRFFREAEPALHTLEEAGYEKFTIGIRVDDPSIEPALSALGNLGCNFGFSNVPAAGEVARITPGAAVGGVVGRDSLTWAAEQESCKDDNREKLREPPGALRRHLCVVVDGSSGTAFSAASHGLTGRLPDLCDPITTVWVAGSSRLLVTTPPGDWEEHLIPQEVFDAPDRWIET